MFWKFGFAHKTVKELRKNQGLTAQELALSVKVETSLIRKVDRLKLKDVPDPLKTKITPILKGDKVDKMPWL